MKPEPRATPTSGAQDEDAWHAWDPVPDVLYRVRGPDGVIESLSAAFERLTGWASGEWMGRPFAQLIHSDDLPRAIERYEASRRGETPPPCELRIRTNAGFFLVAELHSAPLLEAGRVVGACGIARDVTARKRAERMQEAVYRIAEAVVAAPTLQLLFTTIHAVVRQLMPAENLYIALYDDATNTISFPYSVDEFDAVRATREPRKGVTEYVLHTGQPLLATPEVFVELERRGEVVLSGTRAVDWLGVPLKTDKTTGVLAVQSYSERVRYAADHVHLLQFVSTQVALAIERRRAEDALEESERRFRTALDGMRLVGVGLDTEGRIRYANDFLLELTGWRRVDILGADWFERFIPEGSGVKAMFVRGMAVGEMPASFENEIVTRTGERRCIAWNNTVLRDPAGRPAGTVSIGEDITARQAAETAARESETRYRLSDSILQRVGDVIVVVGPEGQVTYTSPAIRAVLGYEPDEVLGDAWWRLTWEDREAGEAMRLASARAARGEIAPAAGSYERAVRARDGTTRWILWHDSKGPGDQLIAVGVDITDRRRLEQQFLQAQKMEAVGQLAGGVAHDFNNLLTAITGYTDLLREDLPAGDRRRADLDEIRHAAERAAGLTRQLLAFSRRQVLQPRVLDLNEVVRGLEKMLRRIIGEDVALETRLSEAIDGVTADPGQIEQVILNLAVNARDAMPDGGRLIVETAVAELDAHYAATHPGAKPGKHVMLAVSDTGVGMSPGTQARIFEPFFTTKTVGKGTGLGLSTVYGIVKQSDGHVGVHSQLGRGTTFKVYLPATGRREGAVRAQLTPAPPARGSETVLLVEDEEAVRTLARQVLERHGYKVLCARNGVEGLKLASEQDGAIRLMVTDLVMPEMGGPELMAQLAVRRPDLKVLYMSGYTDRAVAQQQVLDGKVPYLQKPFTPAALARKVREVLDAEGG